MPSEKFRIGSRVLVTAKTKKIKGAFLPSRTKGITVIKLDSGYNIGIKSNKIKSIKKLKGSKIEKQEKKSQIKQDKNLPSITILHTGGTIASKVDYKTGGTYASFTPEDLLELFPELKSIASIKSELVRNMWSDDLRFKHFTLLGKKIESEISNGTQGIILSMGTDNLAVCAAALSFIVQKSPIPIILVGAQRSSDRPSSDAAINLLSAAYFITDSDFAGVAICMHSSPSDDWCAILPPNKTKKLHTSSRDAFKPVNSEPIALVSVREKKIAFIQKNYLKKDLPRRPVIKPEMEERVGLVKVSVSLIPQQIEIFKGFKGLVIEGTGLGHTPSSKIDSITKDNPKILKAIQSLTKDGTVVVMTSNCIFGNTSLEVYSTGRNLLKAGVIPGEDMLAETALVKLSWLLANSKDVKKMVRENIVGEINDRLLA